MENVFDLIDRQSWEILGFKPAAIISNARAWRIYFTFCVLGSLGAWIVLGFDSTWSMTLPFFENWYALLTGQVSLMTVWRESQLYYGVGNHWSAPVIYGSLWVLTSHYFESINIKQSMNFCATTAFSFMSIGLFEIAWNTMYAFYQGQTWTITYAPKQSENLSMFICFIIVGLAWFLYMNMEGYKPRIDKRLTVLATISLISWILWVNYPLPVGELQVTLNDGTIWQNSPIFPQTYYAIDMYPNDGIAIGEPYYVQDDMVHLINTWTKIITTITLGYLTLFTKKERQLY